MLAAAAAALFVVSFVLLPPPAIASSTIRQLTFIGNDEYISTGVWIEDGVTASGETRHFGSPRTVHLDPGGTPYGGSVSFTTGSRSMH